LTSFVGCSGEKSMDVQTVATSSNLSPQERVLKAAGSGDMETLKSVIASDASLATVRGFNGLTPLHAAAAEGQNAAVTFLLEHGADPMALDDDSSTAINTALAQQHKDTAKILTDAATKGAAPAGQS